MSIRHWIVGVMLAGAFQAGVPAQEHEHGTDASRQRLWAALGVREGAVVADVGAGEGAYTVPLARAFAARLTKSSADRNAPRRVRNGVLMEEL